MLVTDFQILLHQEDFKMKGYLPDDYEVATLSDERLEHRGFHTQLDEGPETP